MTQYTPSVDLTIFPRINFLKTFDPRGKQRHYNGRTFQKFGDSNIDDVQVYPPVDGSFDFGGLLPFPVDLGPDVLSALTELYDLREDGGTLSTYDLGYL